MIASDPVARRGRLSRGGHAGRHLLGAPAGRAGVVLLMLVLVVAFIGPHVAPYGLNQVVGAPFELPSGSHLLGTDTLGRDVFSRFLYGGQTLIIVSVAATGLAYAIGIPIGSIAAHRGGSLEAAVLAVTNLALAFPSLVFILLLIATVGPDSVAVIVLGIAAIHAPRIIRLTRTVALEVAALEFVEAAVARGEGTRWIVFREILPNSWSPLLADASLRLSASVFLFSSLAFLGLGAAPRRLTGAR